jgi:hypothetical protein
MQHSRNSFAYVLIPETTVVSLKGPERDSKKVKDLIALNRGSDNNMAHIWP